MLTRLEVNGFKNLINFSIDFGPLTCIAGPNGVGKSNIFDAIQFLSLLADNTFIEAAYRLRGTNTETADLHEIFWTNGHERLDTLTIAAEMIIEPVVKDDFGREVTASSTFLRYEVELAYEEPSKHSTLGRIVLRREELKHITEGEALSRLTFPHTKNFRKSAIYNKRRTKKGFISTHVNEDKITEILIHQEGNQGNPQRAPADTAPRTIVATTNTGTMPTILAARREMQRWRILALEPSSMRGADRFQDDPHVSANGDHLPATLYRLSNDDDSPERVFSRITSRISDLIPIKSITVDRDDIRQLLVLQAIETSGAKMPARSLSDGTLRFLTLSILSEDPESRGVICMEEPENGIHPAKLSQMVELLRELAVDTDYQVDADNTMRQVIIATHSPGIVQLQDRDDILFALNVTIRDPFDKTVDTIRVRPLDNTWRSKNDTDCVGMGTILAYLTTPPGAQIKLEIPDSY